MTRSGMLGLRVLLVMAAVFVGSLMLAAAAFAAPTVVAVTPQASEVVSAPGWPAVTGSGMPTISALVADATTPMSGQFVVDGVVRPAVADVTGLSFSYKPATSARLQDGPHTVSFNGTDAVGATVSHTWVFEVQQVPYIDSSQPASGAVIGTRRPVVSAYIYDNSLAATYTITVDGVRLSGINSSGYEATWGGYYGIQGTQATDLANGTHTAYLRVTDPGGHTVERTWTFVVFGEITLDTRGISEGQVYDNGRPPLYFSAWSRYSTPSLSVYIDGASAYYDITGGYYSNGNHTLDMTITPKPDYPLSDGPHVVSATAWGAPAGLSVSKTFNIEVRVPPSAYHLRPSGDTVSTSSTPLLVARATENSTSTVQFAFSVDGVPVAASAPRKIATGRWESTAQVVTPLSTNATHTATVVTTDAKGYSAARSWQFFVASGEKMAHYDAGACPTCHGNPYYPHQARGGDAITYVSQYACNNCHTVFPDHATYGWYTKPMVAAQLDDPNTYLPNPWSNNTCSCHSAGHPYHANEANCRNCHDRINTINEQGEPPQGRGETMTLESETPRHVVDGDHSRCTSCHQLDLTFEHAGRMDSGGQPITCQTCHASVDAVVQAAIAAGDGSCGACHENAGVHPHDAAPIAGVEAGDGHLCTECHESDIVAEHSKATSGDGGDPCLTCHAGGRARGAIGGAKGSDCGNAACHAEGSAQPMHATYCQGCHENENTAFSVKQVGFAGAEVVKSRCLACHGTGITAIGRYKVGRKWFGVRHLGHNATEECKNCHYWDPRRTEFYTQSVSTTFGAFATTGSVDPAPSRAHAVHTGGSWPQTIEFAPTIYCANCHEPAACSGCHGVAGVPATHSGHGTQAATTHRVAAGAVSYTAPRAGAVSETRTCESAACHGTGLTVPSCTGCHEGRDSTHW